MPNTTAIKTKTTPYLMCALAIFSAQCTHADVEVKFVESAPKDRFVIKNTGECNLQELILKIDLSQSAGRLIFDTTDTGAGVEVFQPFEVSKGNIELISSKAVKDGDTGLTVRIESLPPGKSASFTIDVDDSLPSSELGRIRVTGSEISNGAVNISTPEEQFATAVFGNDSKATVQVPPCSSSQ